MPLMTLSRDYRLATTKGHSVQFKANKPTYVVPAVLADAVAIGAVVFEGATPDLTPPAQPEVNAGPADAAERERAMIDAINAMITKSDREEFTAGGVPKPDVMSKQLGYKVSLKEVRDVYLKRNEMIAEGMLGPNGERA